MTFPVQKTTTDRSRKIVFATCLLRFDEAVIEAFTQLARSLAACGSRLVVGAADRELPRKEGLAFDVLWLPSSFAEYSPAGTLQVGARPIDDWLLECEAAWARVYSDPVTARKGVSGCRYIADRVIRILQPCACLVWSSGNFPVSRIWHEISWNLGIPTYCLERGHLPGTWMVDSGGLNSQSELVTHPQLQRLLRDHRGSSQAEAYRTWYLQTRPRKYASEDSADDHDKWLRERMGAGARLIVCLGGADDAGLRPRDFPGSHLNSPGFADSIELARHFDAVAARNPGDVFLFKPHPFETGRYSPAMFKAAHLCAAVDVLDLIGKANVIVCGLTSLQFEAVLVGKPVVLTAQTILWGRHIAYEASRPEDLEGCISAALKGVDTSTRRTNAERLLDWLLANYLYRTDPAVPAQGLEWLAVAISQLETPIVGDVNDAREILAASSLNQFGSSGVHSLQVFWSEDGYSEANASRHYWPADGELHTIEISLPGVAPGAVRVDPADAPCLIFLSGLWICTAAGWESFDLLSLPTESCNQCVVFKERDDVCVLCLGPDPIFPVGNSDRSITGLRLIGRKYGGSISGVLAWAVGKGHIPAEKLAAYIEDEAMTAFLRAESFGGDQNLAAMRWGLVRQETDPVAKMRLLEALSSELPFSTPGGSSPYYVTGMLRQLEQVVSRLRGAGEELEKKIVSVDAQAAQLNLTLVSQLQAARDELDRVVCDHSTATADLQARLSAALEDLAARDAKVAVQKTQIDQMTASLSENEARASAQIAELRLRIEALSEVVRTKEEIIGLMNSSAEATLCEHERQLDSLIAELEVTSREAKLHKDELLQQMATARAELALEQERIATLERRLASLLGSWSWRVTGPLRWVRDRTVG